MAVKQLEREMRRRARCVPTTLDVAPTVSWERDISSRIVAKNRRSVNYKSARNIVSTVVAGDLAAWEVGKGELLLLSEVGLLETYDVALWNKVREGAEDEVSAIEARGVCSVVG